MSVQSVSVLCYGYLFPKGAVDYDELDRRAGLAYDNVDFPAYDSYFYVDEYDDKSDIFIGVKLLESSLYTEAVPIDIEQLYKPDEAVDQLNKVIELFNVDIKKARTQKPQYYLLECWY